MCPNASLLEAHASRQKSPINLSKCFHDQSIARMRSSHKHLHAAGDLNDELDNCDSPGLAEERVRDIARQLLLALHYLHTRNIVHRDLKPGNVMCFEDGHVKLGDFGTSGEHVGTSYGPTPGTTPFKAPELFARQDSGYALYNHKVLSSTLLKKSHDAMPRSLSDLLCILHGENHNHTIFAWSIHSFQAACQTQVSLLTLNTLSKNMAILKMIGKTRKISATGSLTKHFALPCR